ncbi:MAG: hypothetical protein LH624_08435, partial [Cryobacterium sp.]|nr:hypothetical protein [Cryobacterium sp.]
GGCDSRRHCYVSKRLNKVGYEVSFLRSPAGSIGVDKAARYRLAAISPVDSGCDDLSGEKGELESEVRLRFLERVQRRVQYSAGGLSILFLFTITFPIPAIVNGVAIVALVWVSLVLDGRIRALGGKGGVY